MAADMLVAIWQCSYSPSNFSIAAMLRCSKYSYSVTVTEGKSTCDSAGELLSAAVAVQVILN